MKRFALFLLLLCFASPAFAQTTVVRPTPFRSGIHLFPSVRPISPEEGTIYQDGVSHILYIYNGSAWVPVGGVVDTGTSGQVLTSQGTGTPVWADVPATTSVSALTGSVTMTGAHGTAGQVLTSNGSGATTWSDVSGSGVPGGSAGAVQYKNGGNFGGTNLTFSGSTFTSGYVSNYGGNWIHNTNGVSSESTETFDFMIGSASNDTGPGDTRPDRVASIGWNGSGAASGALPNGTGVGSSILSFESYCSYGTGCLGGGGGQSETYFSMDDGYGHSTRPLGFFQGKFMDPDHAGYLSVIARANTWGFFDFDQTAPIMSIDQPGTPGDPGGIRMYDSVLSFNSSDLPVTHITFSGNNALGRGDDGIEVGRNGSVVLAPGGDGSSYVLLNPASIRTQGSTLFDANANPRFSYGAGSATNYGSIGAAGTDEIIVKPLGSTSNILLTLQSQGNGIVRLNPQGTGYSQLGKHVKTFDSVPTVAGTTSNACGTTAPSIAGTDTAGRVTVGATSGTSCTVTFNHQYLSSVPACVANNETTAGVVKATATTQTLILAGSFTAGDKLTYICMEY